MYWLRPVADMGTQVTGAPQTHGWTMPNGRHKGVLITRVPVNYLKWMVNAGHQHADHARAELDRRGTVTPEIDISGHAIDRASLLCRWCWHETSNEGEGLHAWLVRVAQEALEQGETHPDHPERRAWIGLSFRFELDGVWPVLKTVLPANKRKAKE